MFCNLYSSPAVTNEDNVEILKVSLPSPPVPHKSIVLNSLKSTEMHNSSSASRNLQASRLIFLIIKTVRKEAICELLYLPSAILVIISLASFLLRDS